MLRRILIVIGALCVIGLFWTFMAVDPRQVLHQSSAAESFPVRPDHPLPESPFLNVSEATEIGSQQCAECHQAEADAFYAFGMGRSAAPVFAQNEPPESVVEHSLSFRKYVIEKDGDDLRHIEYLWNENNENPDGSILIEDQALTVRIGSGRFARTYLTEIDGFLVESPVTWYTARERWDMSPGYDHEFQQGFERGVGQECLRCHVGKSEPIDNSVHRMRITEHAISCERCHGPGGLHQTYHSLSNSETLTTTEIDRTIVNPVHLTQERSIDVCAQCHLEISETVAFPGRSIDDFKPGLPLDAFRVDFHADVPDSEMKVVGHVAQLRQSKCFQLSEMTCVTCHNPHHRPAPDETIQVHRENCLLCHETQSCNEDLSIRQQTLPVDNCLDCHMPTADTEIPHVAFTHHRIGIHRDNSEPTANATAALSPVKLVTSADLSQLSHGEQAGLLGLAYLRALETPNAAAEYEQRAYRHLKQAWKGGVVDAAMAGNLASLAARFNDPNMMNYAKFALTDKDLDGPTHVAVLNAIANRELVNGNYAQAASAAEQLTILRRHWYDWMLRAQIEQHRGHEEAALEYLEKVIEINPFEQNVRKILLQHAEATGDEEQVEQHRAWFENLQSQHHR